MQVRTTQKHIVSLKQGIGKFESKFSFKFPDVDLPIASCLLPLLLCVQRVNEVKLATNNGPMCPLLKSRN